MSPTQKNIIGIFLFGLIVYIGFFDYHLSIQNNPCKTPIHYKLGSIDPKFGVSSQAFQQDITQASAIWEQVIDKKIFIYDPKAALTINLVYDTRQQTTQTEQTLNQNINNTSNTAASVKQQYTTLQTQYQNLEQQYNDQVQQFTQAQNTYTNKVQYSNTHGGASKQEYATLQTEQNNLIVQRNVLTQKEQQLNALAKQINTFIDNYNLLVSHINTDVHTINTDGLSGTEFEEGVYVYDNAGKRINIYQFENQTDLIRVLAHELGHAMGLEHNTNPQSIMNPVNQGTKLTLSTDDINELKAVCKLQ